MTNSQMMQYLQVPGYNPYQMASPETAASLANVFGTGVVQTNPVGPVQPPPQNALNFGGGTDPQNAGLLNYSLQNNTYGTLLNQFVADQLKQSQANPSYPTGNPTQSQGAGLAPTFNAVPGMPSSSPSPVTVQQVLSAGSPAQGGTGGATPAPTTATPTPTAGTQKLDPSALLAVMSLIGQLGQSGGNQIAAGAGNPNAMGMAANSAAMAPIQSLFQLPQFRGGR